MYQSAYLAILVDVSNPDSPKILEADTFSERSPTLPHTIRALPAIIGHGKDYEEGLADIRRQLSSPYHEWLLPLLSPRTRADLI